VERNISELRKFSCSIAKCKHNQLENLALCNGLIGHGTCFLCVLLLIFRRNLLLLSSDARSLETEILFQILVPVYRNAKRHIPQDGNLHSHYVLTHREENEVLRRYNLVCLSDTTFPPAFYMSIPPVPRSPHFESGFVQAVLV
jgi:hypothetical protein